MKRPLTLALASLALAGCAEGAAPTGPRLALTVAPLDLPGVRDVEYAVAVFDAEPASPTFDVAGAVVGTANQAALVWQRAGLTSGRFGSGAGGDLAYVGTCDASQAFNWVALVLQRVAVGDGEGSYDGTAPLAGTRNILDDEVSSATTSPGSGDGRPDFVNPCDYAAPCLMKVRCAENEDTEVRFDLTVMRQASQGFFDVAVDFEDVFCSMKIDTCYAGSQPIELLFDDAGQRAPTAVIASACSAGAGSGSSVIWMAPLTVTCDGGVSFTIDPTGDDDADPTTPGIQGNQETDAALPGAKLADGTRATGTLDLAVTPTEGFAGLTLPRGTVVTRTDGRQYATDADVTLTAAAPTAEVAATAVEVGAAQDQSGTETFYPIAARDASALPIDVTVTGLGFSGGADAVFSAGSTTTVGYAVYWGDEQLTCGPDGASCDKVYWNVALNLGDLRAAGYANCRVTTAITSSGGPAPARFVNGGLAGPGETYGFVAIDARVTDEASAPTCFQGPMGSERAAPEYGGSADMIGALPFPHLCAYYQEGDSAPRSLGDLDGYFSDPDATPESATYAGRISTVAGETLDLAFDGLGGDATGPCRSRVLNLGSAVYFDGAARLQEFTWTGAGGSGAYRIQVFTKAGGRWFIRGGYTVDLRTDLGRSFFTAGQTFSNAGDGEVAFVVTRTDLPVTAVDDLTIRVGP